MQGSKGDQRSIRDPSIGSRNSRNIESSSKTNISRVNFSNTKTYDDDSDDYTIDMNKYNNISRFIPKDKISKSSCSNNDFSITSRPDELKKLINRRDESIRNRKLSDAVKLKLSPKIAKSYFDQDIKCRHCNHLK
jgi:hypothetical protein